MFGFRDNLQVEILDSVFKKNYANGTGGVVFA